MLNAAAERFTIARLPRSNKGLQVPEPIKTQQTRAVNRNITDSHLVCAHSTVYTKRETERKAEVKKQICTSEVDKDQYKK